MRTSGQYSSQQIAGFESQVAEIEERKNSLGQQGTKRKMEDITQTRDTYQYNRILDLHKALKVRLQRWKRERILLDSKGLKEKRKTLLK